MSETPKIPDDAIQAAAEAYQESCGSLKQRIQVALEAAAPHMEARASYALEAVSKVLSDAAAFGRQATDSEILTALRADAWDEGWNDGAGWPQQDINPYRKASA